MNWMRSGSSYGSFQSMSVSMYGETRTLIGARAKPVGRRRAMNSSDTRPRSASSSLSGRVIEFFACQR